MELSQIEALLTISETGTFSAAAARLSLTQSALSRKIQALEAECGETLLVRSRPRVEPTTMGREVLACGRRIRAEVEHLRELFSPEVGGSYGKLRAASTDMGINYVYWGMCEQFLRAYPNIEMTFVGIETPADGPRLVRGGGVDVAFTVLPIAATARDLEVLPLGNVEQVLVTHPDDSLTADGEVSLHRLRDLPLLLYQRRADKAHFVDQLFEKLGGYPAALLETGNTEYIKRLVMLGRGISILPWPAVEREIETGKMVQVRVAEGRFFQDFGLVYSSGRVSRAVRVLADFCRGLCPAQLHSPA